MWIKVIKSGSFSLSHFVSLSLSLSQSLQKLSKLSQCHSLKITHSPPLAWLILNVPATETWHHRPINCPKPPISLRPTPPIWVLARGYWVPDWETYGAHRPTPSTNLACWRCACLWLVILFGLGWGKRLEIGVFFFFFFPAVDWWWWWLWLWLWLMVEVVVVGAVEVFFDSGIYYFIVMVILFYCDVYIILLCWKIK